MNMSNHTFNFIPCNLVQQLEISWRQAPICPIFGYVLHITIIDKASKYEGGGF